MTTTPCPTFKTTTLFQKFFLQGPEILSSIYPSLFVQPWAPGVFSPSPGKHSPHRPLWRPAHEPSQNTPLPFPIFVSTLNNPWWRRGRQDDYGEESPPPTPSPPSFVFVLLTMLLFIILFLSFFYFYH